MIDLILVLAFVVYSWAGGLRARSRASRNLEEWDAARGPGGILPPGAHRSRGGVRSAGRRGPRHEPDARAPGSAQLAPRASFRCFWIRGRSGRSAAAAASMLTAAEVSPRLR